MDKERLKRWGANCGIWGCALVMLTLTFGSLFVRYSLKPTGGRRFPTTIELFSGLRLATASRPGYACVTIEHAYTQARRMGIFVVGNFKTLILEGVHFTFSDNASTSLTPPNALPPSSLARHDEAKADLARRNDVTSAHATLQTLFPGTSFEQIQGVTLKEVHFHRRTQNASTPLFSAAQGRLSKTGAFTFKDARLYTEPHGWRPLRSATLSAAPAGGFVLTTQFTDSDTSQTLSLPPLW